MAQTPPNPPDLSSRIRSTGQRLSRSISKTGQRIARGIGSTYQRAQTYYRNSPRLQKLLWQRRFAPAFWTITSLLSLAVNIVLIAALLILGRQLFSLKKNIDTQLLKGLYDNFALMDQAHIVTTIDVETTILVQDTIHVQDSMPVVFDLPLNQDTRVVLTENTPIDGVQIMLNGFWIPTDIILPRGTPLPIALDMTVPVSQTIPVNLTVPISLSVPVSLQVPVDIPLDQTELHAPFTGLQEVVSPYHALLSSTPDSAEEIGACQTWWGGWLCRILFGAP
jgi:hypothetical protein